MDLENPALEPGMAAAPMLPPAAPVHAAVAQAVPASVAARAKQQAAARAKRQAVDSPEALVLAKREQSLAPYVRAVQTAEARLNRFGVLDRLQNSQAYEQARTRLELARSAFGKAEAMLEGRQAQMLQDARRLFESRSESPVPQATPAGSVIEMDPGHQRAATMLGG